MTNEKIQLLTYIVSELTKDTELCELTLRNILTTNTISIAELVKYKEDAMKEVMDKNKEDLSNASALLIRHNEKINTKNLKEETEKFIKKQGFFKL